MIYYIRLRTGQTARACAPAVSGLFDGYYIWLSAIFLYDSDIFGSKRVQEVTKYQIRGGTPLHGTIEISGAKNAAVAIIPAALMVDGTCRS